MEITYIKTHTNFMQPILSGFLVTMAKFTLNLPIETATTVNTKNTIHDYNKINFLQHNIQPNYTSITSYFIHRVHLWISFISQMKVVIFLYNVHINKQLV